MQGLIRTVRFCRERVHIKKQEYLASGSILNLIKQGFNGATVARSHSMPETGLQNTTVAEVLSTKGQDKVGSWLWCRTDDTVYDAVKQVSIPALHY